MLPLSNFKARQLSSAPQLHRSSVLSSISAKTHKTTAQIVFSKTKALQAQAEMAAVPDDALSRLQWMQNQLHRS